MNLTKYKNSWFEPSSQDPKYNTLYFSRNKIIAYFSF